MLSNENQQEEKNSAVVYFAPEEEDGATELLLFEEHVVKDPRWSRRASEKGRQFWQRTKDKLEHLTDDIFAGDRFVRKWMRFQKITVLLNKPIEPAVVRERLRIIFRDRSYHHLRWLIVDALLLPFTLLIVPLPGPNVIGYYLLFRVYSHWRSFRSASRATLEQVDVKVSNRAEEVSTLLRRSKDIRASLQELRKKYGLRALQEHNFIPQSSVMKEAWSRMKRSLSHKDGA